MKEVPKNDELKYQLVYLHELVDYTSDIERVACNLDRLCKKADLQQRKFASQEWHGEDNNELHYTCDEALHIITELNEDLMQGKFDSQGNVPESHIFSALIKTLTAQYIIPYEGFTFWRYHKNEGDGEYAAHDYYFGMRVPNVDPLSDEFEALLNADKLPPELIKVMLESSDMRVRMYFRVNESKERDEVVEAFRTYVKMCAMLSREWGDTELAELFLVTLMPLARFANKWIASEADMKDDELLLTNSLYPAVRRLRALAELKKLPTWEEYKAKPCRLN